MPWLYYSPEKASTTLTATDLTSEFNSNSLIPIKLAAFMLNGSFIGYKDAVGEGLLQLCKDSFQRMIAAFKFGTVYYKQVVWISEIDFFGYRL
ncbi:unnamed protein product [Protopolystoma xenopodis]|uniref:Uncharacterized protein n=1 Tax=Protopolystoma xenopodis TaxID=117903 RepID=A0A448WL10_9PLAT|nr:unnamed protein product [Protopolystoma xenopodis]